VRPLGFPKRKLYTEFEVSSSRIFEDMFDRRMPKTIRVTWPKARPFHGKLFMHPHGFPKTNLCTKHDVPSSNSFEDMLGRLP